MNKHINKYMYKTSTSKRIFWGNFKHDTRLKTAVLSA